MLFMKECSDGIVFKIFVQPKSSKNMIVGLYGDALKVKIAAPPVDGSANKMCVKYIAKCLMIPKSSVEIISGHASRTKQALVKCISEKERERLKKLIRLLCKGKKK